MEELFNSAWFWSVIAGVIVFVGTMYKIMAAKNNLPVNALDDVVEEGVKLANQKAVECAEKEVATKEEERTDEK